MASSRQLTDGFYLSCARTREPPPVSQLSALLDNLLLDFERRLTTKIFDLNRTVTALSSEVRRSVTVENVPELVFELGMLPNMGGRKQSVSTVAELVKVVPVHSLVRKHYGGDFCIVLPLLRCVHNVPATSLETLPAPAFTPHFSAVKNEIFVALCPSPFSNRFLEVFSPFPGPGPAVESDQYGTMRLSFGTTDFFFPPESKESFADGDEEQVELMKVQKGDVGAWTKPGALSNGDVLLVRSKHYSVKNVTGGGEAYEMGHGADMVVFDKAFNFNAKKAVARRCLPVLIRAKHGYLPRSALADFEPVCLKFLSAGAAHKLDMGEFCIEFSSLAFNKELVCHRDSVLRPNFPM